MTQALPSPQLRFDDVLGRASQRYFTAGYRRVRQEVSLESAESLKGGAGVRLRGVGRALYPSDWSLSPQGEPRQAHLSSIDALVLSVAMIERLADSSPAWADLADSRLSKVSIRAGTSPVHDLNSIPVLVEMERGAPQSGASAPYIATALVGGFTVELTLSSGHGWEGVDCGASPYVEGFRGTRLESWVLGVNHSLKELVTRHRVAIEPLPARGVDSPIWPCLTHVDNIVLFGQIAQVLVHLVDGVARGSIDNLWMRRMTFERDPDLPSCVEFSARATLTSHSRVIRAGRVLHSLDMTARSDHGVTASARFGYMEAT